ncbi:MAG TPA: hypothetical protein VF132_02835 [Rudaea sp.]
MQPTFAGMRCAAFGRAKNGGFCCSDVRYSSDQFLREGQLISLLDTFTEATNPIPFTSNAALPGDQVATLHVTLAAGATVGDTIALTLDATLTQLSDQAGTQHETSSSANLTLANGQIAVTAATAVRLQDFDVR